MNQSSRRGFLALTGTGVAAVAVAPAAFASGDGAPDAVASPEGPMVAYVHDAATGEIALMVGEREVVVRDPQLVARLATHLRS